MLAPLPYLLAPTVAVLIVSISLVVIRKWTGQLRRNKLLHSRHQDFDGILAGSNPYYKSLTPEGRHRFLKRVLLFIDSKKFKYIDLEREESMPLLVGAAAVQLTFGLDHYKLDYFKTVYIIKDKYTYGLYKTPFEGHVSRDGIFLSWTHFIREFADYSDGQNVGLHEMAHALTYSNFTVTEGRDKTFHDSFVDFSAIARPIFERMKAGETTLLSSYAVASYPEFWAVCVEAFFERSSSFKNQLPELYHSLCLLLNQDPLTTDKILSAPSP